MGNCTGVDYCGSNTGIYSSQLLTSTNELRDDRYKVDNHNGVGKCITLCASQISFTFDLKGPSFILDTSMYVSYLRVPGFDSWYSLFRLRLHFTLGRFRNSP